MAQRITAIEEQERRTNRRSVFVDGKFVLGVDESVIADLGLRVGQLITEEELQAVVQAELVSKARQKALRLLEYRPRSREEVRIRLTRAGFAEDVVEETLRRLEALGLIDDAAFSQSWVSHRLAGKGMGKARIKWELRLKGVATEVVEEALSALDADTEYESALASAERRWQKGKEVDQRAKRRRLASYLRRQGYGWDIVSRVLTELSAENESD